MLYCRRAVKIVKKRVLGGFLENHFVRRVQHEVCGGTEGSGLWDQGPTWYFVSDFSGLSVTFCTQMDIHTFLCVAWHLLRCPWHSSLSKAYLNINISESLCYLQTNKSSCQHADVCVCGDWLFVLCLLVKQTIRIFSLSLHFSLGTWPVKDIQIWLAHPLHPPQICENHTQR